MRYISVLLYTSSLLYFFGSTNSHLNDTFLNRYNNLEMTSEQKKFTINDLVTFSTNKYGFVEHDGSINEYYGDFNSLPSEKELIEFEVGCGRGGDIVSLLVKESNTKSNSFDLFIPKGGLYYGYQASTDKKVGEFYIASENEIRGNLKLCMEKDAACCGEAGETFTLKILPDHHKSMYVNKTKLGFTAKNSDQLPIWFDNVERQYMLNDARIYDVADYIGAYITDIGYVFFINNTYTTFTEENKSYLEENNIITVTLKSGNYTIKIKIDKELRTGAYDEGTIRLYYENQLLHNSNYISS